MPAEVGGALNRQEEDRKIFEGLIGSMAKRNPSERASHRIVIEVGKLFLESPYRAWALESEEAERLVVNLREHDCVTFVETVVALTRLVSSRKRSFEAFRALLQTIRYRQGKIRGHPSRLHYFSDWIYDNQRKGIVREVTAEIGGKPFKKTIHFMTSHPELYPRLMNSADFRRMKSIERTLSKRTRFFLPKKGLRRFEDGIREGDLIAITTSQRGLDVLHVGFAARVRNRVHLLHASSAAGRVTFSKETLYRYLMQNRIRSGIMVARIL